MSRPTKLILLLLVLLLVAVALAIFFYKRYQSTQVLLSNPQAANQAQTKALVQKVGKFMELPQGEDPTVATVLDRDKLKSEPFFATAKNGDQLLIYPKAKKAILYRPSENKIINVAPLSIGSDASPTPSPSRPSTSSLRISLYNGTDVTGATNAIATQLGESIPNVEVVSRSNANKQTYQKSLVVDLTGENASQVQHIASLLGADVGPLPQGEVSPSTPDQPVDILVIVGKAK